MSAIIGTHLIDLWEGPVPPQIKSAVHTIFRPGQASAAAKVLPSQSHELSVQTVQFRTASGAGVLNPHVYVDGLRALIGTTLALTYSGTSYGNVFIGDITPLAIEIIPHASGTHPDGSTFNLTPAAKITCRWHLIRLS